VPVAAVLSKAYLCGC